MMFKKTDNPSLVRKLTRFRRMWARATNLRFVRFVERFEPDAVLCTHYLPVEILGELASRGRRLFTVSVVTDFEAHALWMEQSVDLYCVATEETRASLVARGAEAERIIATGIPISGRFARKVDAAVVRRGLGIRDDLPTLLVLSGGFGMGPVREIVEGLDAVNTPVQVLVVAGKNAELRAELAARDYRHPTRVLGFVTNMHELMSAADLIVTKPGGLTTSEALALGRPLFILNPIPGQEAANSDFLLERGAAAKVNRVEDIGFRLDQLLGSKQLGEMARAARRLGRPDAAPRICRVSELRLRRFRACPLDGPHDPGVP
jgi:processive 1,2-diacylglycerol beta-glucosyltransferase